MVSATGEDQKEADELAALWSFSGKPADFWRVFLEVCARLINARAALIMVRERDAPVAWKRLSPWPAAADAQALMEVDEPVASSCLLNGIATRGLTRTASQPQARVALAIKLFTRDQRSDCLAVFLLDDAADGRISAAADTLRPVAYAPLVYQERQALEQVRSDAERTASVLDLLALISGQNRFLAMAMTLCNELAARQRCEKVSLGWMESDGYLHVKAISHTERFERKMLAVKQIESAMEEAFDQDNELVWPPPPETSTVTREHEQLARNRGIDHVCSLPLRQHGKPVAVLLAERQAGPFDETDLALLRLSCDMATPRLADLKRRDQWFGARWRQQAREFATRLVGVEHTWAKIGAASAALLLGILLFGRMTYRVEGNFILKTEQAVAIPALFDGYIGEVAVDLGDRVAAGQDLLILDTRELRLEEASAVADHQRYVREAEKSRAENRLADMQIAQALADQAKARMDLIRDRIQRSRIVAPFDGIVVDGDLRERVGSPVRLGDPLFRLARMDDLYIRMEVDESQIHEIETGMPGSVAMVSQPQQKFPVRVARVDPIAQSKDQKNVFSIRCDFTGEASDWWRPGMSGVGKIEVGRRNILWIFTRRTADFLRLRLWW